MAHHLSRALGPHRHRAAGTQAQHGERRAAFGQRHPQLNRHRPQGPPGARHGGAPGGILAESRHGNALRVGREATAVQRHHPSSTRARQSTTSRADTSSSTVAMMLDRGAMVTARGGGAVQAPGRPNSAPRGGESRQSPHPAHRARRASGERSPGATASLSVVMVELRRCPAWCSPSPGKAARRRRSQAYQLGVGRGIARQIAHEAAGPTRRRARCRGS